LETPQHVELRRGDLQSRRPRSSHRSTPEVNSLKIQWSIRSILGAYFSSG
jgi:hypothetical protein